MRRLVLPVLVTAMVAGGCAQRSTGIWPLQNRGQRYVDRGGLSLIYPAGWYGKRLGGAWIGWEITLASFKPQSGCTSNEHGFRCEGPPVDANGRFPRDAAAIRIIRWMSGPPVPTTMKSWPETPLPLRLERLSAPRRPRKFGRPFWRSIDVILRSAGRFSVDTWVGSRASLQHRGELARMVASLHFSPPRSQ